MKNIDLIIDNSLNSIGYIPMGVIISELKKKELKQVNPFTGLAKLPYRSEVFKIMDANLSGLIFNSFVKYGPPSGLRSVVEVFEPQASTNPAITNLLSSLIKRQSR